MVTPSVRVRKHRAPQGALRRSRVRLQQVDVAKSQSTERQKVHLDERRMTATFPPSAGQKAPSAPNFARNSLLSTLYQLSEIAEFQRSDFKR